MKSAPHAFLPRPVAVVMLLSLLLATWCALRYPLFDPDEGRNAEVAREMAAGGDVVIPHLAGLPYLDKPPLLFAAAALSIRVLGPVPLAARLPAILAALATLLVLARAAMRLGGADHARRAVMLTASAPLFAALAAYVIFDMPLALFVTLVWTSVAIEVESGRSAAGRATMFLAIALGVLDKGPVMLAWAIGGSLCAALVLRSRAPLRWLGWAPGWAIVIALAGGWFALALRRHPEYAHYAFLEESLQRLSTKAFHRRQGVWFVPAVLAGGALPWVFTTPWRVPATRAGGVAAGFVLFAVAFFTPSQSQLVTYLLPAFPALAWWASECWGRRGPALPRWALAPLLLAPLALVGGAPWLARWAAGQSGAALAGEITRRGGGTVVYEDCYSPGTDYLLGRTSGVVSRSGDVLTSNYVLRYRETLKARGQWRLDDSLAAAPPADVIVRPARRVADAAPGWSDARFAAFFARR